ncbi:hypothetical protein ACHAWX_007092 [Stephanocyclus meneghinianus]
MDDEIKDVECPLEPSPTIVTDETASSVTETSSPPPTPSIRAPSPPRWRFVNEAKSTLGYSSLSAGRVVNGKSAEELGAKYIPPDISLYRPKDDEKEVGKLEIVREKKEDEEKLPEATFAGLPAKEIPETKQPRMFREWDQTYHRAAKLIKDFVWFDGEVDDRYKVGDLSSVQDERNVGKLQPRSNLYADEKSTGQFVMPKKDDTPENESDRCWQMAIDSAWQLSNEIPENEKAVQTETAYESISASNCNEHQPPSSTSLEICDDEFKEEKCKRKFYEKKSFRCYSILFLFLLSVILFGALFGTRSKYTTNQISAAAVAAITVTNSSDVPSFTPSASPSVIPSASLSGAPSSGCPVGEKDFFLDHSIPNFSNDLHNATWELRDSCSGELVLACLPCSLGTVVLGNRNGRSMQIEILQPLTQCIPSGKEYSFHVYSTDNPDSCCGFDVNSFYLRYDNEQYSIADDLLLSYGDDVNYTIYVGERDTPCRSAAAQVETLSSPSLWPTFQLSTDPSNSPTLKPTASPTKSPSSPPTPSPASTSPVTNLPTKQPLEFVGGCPEQFIPLSYYTIGTQVESDGIVYECINYGCGSYGFEPGSNNSTLWQQGWAVIGTCDGTRTPTSRPTVRVVTSSPTELPTTKPVSCTTKADFNLCLALDNSGSICGFGIDDCLFCEPALFCSNLFSFLPPSTCCNNYADIIEFSKLMVFALEQFEAEKSFSLVQFATNAQLISNLATANVTLDVLDNVRYTGGSTEFGEPIRLCQQSFASSSDPNRKNFIMLITDGLPATTSPDPVIVAQEEADNAKSNGTIIIPVFISEYNDAYALAFMSSLSSDGEVFDVTGFASLDTLKDSLIEQVSCS